MLLLLGIGIRLTVDYFGLFKFNFNAVLPALGTLGLILIVFEGSLELKYSKSKNSIIIRSFLSALCILLLTAAVITAGFWYISGESMYKCFINAIPFCVVSSAVAIPSASGMGKDKKEFIIYESSFSDILSVVLFNFILSNNQHINVGSFAKLGVELLLILFVAAASCLLLLYLIGRLTHHVKSFLIISILVLVYCIGQSQHLSSLIIVLALGLFLNNAGQIKLTWFRKYFIYPTLPYDIKQLFQLSAESAFLMRTFFFVIFGYTMDVFQLQNISVLVNGGMVLILIYLVRFAYIKVVLKTSLMPELILIPRGLISVLLFYNLPSDVKIANVGTGLLFVVILGTSIVMSLGLLGIKRPAQSTQEFGDV